MSSEFNALFPIPSGTRNADDMGYPPAPNQPQPTPQGTPPPPRIWLQWEGDQEPDNYAEHEGVTWAATQIWKHDVEYVRAAQLSTAQARASAAETALARAEKLNFRLRTIVRAAYLHAVERLSPDDQKQLGRDLAIYGTNYCDPAAARPDAEPSQARTAE